MSTQHVPVCTFKTSPCVPAPRERIEREHGDVWSGHTGEERRREGPSTSSFFIGTTSVFGHLSSIFTGCWVHLISPIFRLPKFAHIWVITCFRGSPKKALDLTYIENGASSIIERSALARCNVLIIRNKNTLQTICSATFTPVLSCSFFFLFFYDDAMRGTTTQRQRPPRQRHVDNTTPHHTTPNQPTTMRDTRHDTAPHNKKTKTHTYTHM